MEDQPLVSDNIPEEAEVLTNKDNSAVDFNVVLEAIGDLGRYQIILVLIAYTVTLSAGMHMVGAVFLEATPDHRCALPPLDDHPKLYPNLTADELQNFTIPRDGKTNDYSECERYNYSLSSCTPATLDCIKPYPPTPPQVVVIKCDNGYRYDKEIYDETVVTEWNLVCDRVIIESVVSSVFYFGILVGALVGGNVADRYGRLPTMLVCQLGLIGLSIGCAFAPNLVGYAALRFSLAILVQASYLSCCVYVMEITGNKWKTVVGINTQLMFTVGELILSLFAYLWRDWRKLQLYMSFIPVIFCLLALFLPESPRWLFGKGKTAEGEAISEKMARRNGKPLDHDVWARARASGQNMLNETRVVKYYSPVELFRRPKMRWITVNLIYVWFVTALVYYGLALNVGSLAGDVFVNNTLNAAVEFVAYIGISFTMDRLGRNPLLVGALGIAGITCLISTFVKVYAPWVTVIATIASLIGKCCVTGAFAILSNYTVEIYPTIIRSTGLGVTVMGARIGGTITPFVLELHRVLPWLPGTIFGVTSIVASLTSLRLPETMRAPMLTSLDEAEEFYESKRRRVINDPL